eukprot:3640240-Amphidinium_carterae.1
MVKALPPVHRSAPFPVAFLEYLEDLLMCEQVSDEARYKVGVLLFLTFTRSRFSDAQGITQEPVIEFGNIVTQT